MYIDFSLFIQDKLITNSSKHGKYYTFIHTWCNTLYSTVHVCLGNNILNFTTLYFYYNENISVVSPHCMNDFIYIMAPTDTHRVSVTSKHSRQEDNPDYDNEGLTCHSDAVYHGLNPRFLQCPPLYPQIMGKYTKDHTPNLSPPH